ncbi:MAG: replicative DNA helicase [Crocinitomicaceae bacterium]|nr:replicative DNA helicase [Crocinitomicaceae bacterium]|tara:strand:- start:1242 stop:2789 length:1548 start_codon:yes stop_codon:yes gene_type:complete
MSKLSDNLNPTQKAIRRISKPIDSGIVGAGKLPPQSVDLEEAVLGALMLEKGPLNDVIDIINRPDIFYKDAHKKIYEAIQQLFSESESIDILTVTQRLRQNGDLDACGGPYYISQLTNRVASAAHAETHARIIVQKFILRELIRISGKVIQHAYDETTDVFNLLDEAESELFAVAEGNIRKDYQNMTDLILKAKDEIEVAMSKEDGINGVATGFTDLDRVTSGWQKSDMIVIAARPGMGKTAFVISMARNVAVDYKHPVAIFSLEMSSVQLVNRLISGEAEIPAEDIRRGKFTKKEFDQFFHRTKQLSDAPLFIDDTPALSIFELRAKCRRLKQQHDIQLVVIDYLQLMSSGGKGGNREQEISTISRSIKEIAKELDIPIIALSQLSRNVETRGGDKRPMLSDLRDSGAIEQDADIVCFIYRPEYYGLTEWSDGTPCNSQGEIIVSKHRNGSLKDVRLRFIGKYAKFANMDSFADEYMPDSLQPNKDFTQSMGGSYTVQSKMNDDDIDVDDDGPF